MLTNAFFMGIGYGTIAAVAIFFTLVSGATLFAEWDDFEAAIDRHMSPQTFDLSALAIIAVLALVK